MAPSDEAELAGSVATAAAIDDAPSAFRYPRGEGVGVPIPENLTPWEIGKGRVIRQGERLAVLSIGTAYKMPFTLQKNWAMQGLKSPLLMPDC